MTLLTQKWNTKRSFKLNGLVIQKKINQLEKWVQCFGFDEFILCNKVWSSVCPSDLFITSFDEIILFIPAQSQPLWLKRSSSSPRWRAARCLWLAGCEIERMTGTQIGVCRVVSCRIMPQRMREAINKIREIQRFSERKVEQLQNFLSGILQQVLSLCVKSL